MQPRPLRRAGASDEQLSDGRAGAAEDRGDSPAEKAREEFFSEAQELVDGLGRDLLALDEQLKQGSTATPSS